MNTDLYEQRYPSTMLLYITTGTNSTLASSNYNVNLSGKYRLKLVGAQFQFTTDPTYVQLELRSPQLQIKYGNINYPVLSYPIAGHAYRMPNTYEFETNIFNGVFPLQIVDYTTKLPPTNFAYALLNFEVVKLN